MHQAAVICARCVTCALLIVNSIECDMTMLRKGMCWPVRLCQVLAVGLRLWGPAVVGSWRLGACFELVLLGPDTGQAMLAGCLSP
jgi:hypothetical protein